MASLQERNGWFHLLFRYQGRQFRLTDVYGRLVKDILV